jgi:hypothetical protein
LLTEIGQKIILIGGIEVFEELRNTISDLRRHTYPLPVEPQGREPVKPTHLQNLSSFAHKLWLLKEDLQLTELNQQIYRLRKRLALSEFFDTYTTAQDHGRYSLRGDDDDDDNATNTPLAKRRRRDRKTKAGPIIRKAQSATSVQNRFVDLLFPETVATGASLTEEDKMKRVCQRKTAVQKIQNWRKCGKPWSMLIERFGKGILLMLLKDISDEKSVSHLTSSTALYIF